MLVLFCFVQAVYNVFLKSLNGELDALRKRLDNEVEKVSSLESKVLELEVGILVVLSFTLLAVSLPRINNKCKPVNE